MITKLIFLIFIFYLIYIYNNLYNDKELNIDTYLNKSQEIIKNLEKKNKDLAEQANSFENKVIESKSNYNNLLKDYNSKNTEIKNLNNNINEEKKVNKNFSEAFKGNEENEKNLYFEISDLKSNKLESDKKVEEIKEENIKLKKEAEILYKYIKIYDYAMYEEILKEI